MTHLVFTVSDFASDNPFSHPPHASLHHTRIPMSVRCE